jgi:hypothetical protein
MDLDKGPKTMDNIKSVSTVSIQPSASNSGAVSSNLQVGQQVSGQVLQGQNGEYLLNINGQTVTAQTELPLNPGDLLQLEFQGLREGVLSLRLLTLNRSLAFFPLTFEDLSAQLAQLKLPMTEMLLELAKAMTEFGIPLTRENVQELLQAVGGKTDDATMQAASFLKSAELPLTPENVQILANFFKSEPQLGAYLAQLQSFSFPTADGRLAQLLSLLPGLLGEYLLDPKSTKSKNVSRMDRLAQLAGIKGKENGPSLFSLLSEIKKEAEQSGKHQNLQSLSTLLGKIGELVQGEHLLNADNRSDSFLYFQVPINLSGEKATAHIRIQCEKDEHGKKIVNPERTRLEFAVSTPNMGTVQCHLDLYKRQISAKLFVDEAREDFVEAHLGWLKEAVEKLHYKLSSAKVSSEPHAFWSHSKTDFKNIERVSVKV